MRINKHKQQNLQYKWTFKIANIYWANNLYINWRGLSRNFKDMDLRIHRNLFQCHWAEHISIFRLYRYCSYSILPQTQENRMYKYFLVDYVLPPVIVPGVKVVQFFCQDKETPKSVAVRQQTIDGHLIK